MVNKINKLLKLMRKANSNLFSTLFVKVIAAAIAFSFTIYIARTVGVGGTGHYFWLISVLTIMSTFSRLGLGNAMLKHIAIYSSTSELNKIHTIFSFGIKRALIASFFLTIGLFLASAWIATNVIKNPEVEPFLQIISFSLVPFTIFGLISESLKGLKNTASAIIIQTACLPLLGFPLVWVFTKAVGEAGLYFSHVVASVITMVIAFFIWWKLSPPNKEKTDNELVDLNSLVQMAKHLFVTTFVQKAILPWMPVTILGIYSTMDETALYAVSIRVGMLVSLLLMAVNARVAPAIAKNYANNDIGATQALVSGVSTYLVIALSPLVFAIIIYSDFFLGLFGEGFEKGVWVLRIVLFAQMVSVVCGPINYVLMMSGEESLYRKITLLGAFLSLICCFATAPYFGAVGVAMSYALGLTAVNVLSTIVAKRKLGVRCYAFAKNN